MFWGIVSWLAGCFPCYSERMVIPARVGRLHERGTDLGGDVPCCLPETYRITSHLAKSSYRAPSQLSATEGVID
jgi:hypothetical protein